MKIEIDKNTTKVLISIGVLAICGISISITKSLLPLVGLVIPLLITLDS